MRKVRPAVLVAFAGCATLVALAPALFLATGAILLLVDARRRQAHLQGHSAQTAYLLGGGGFWLLFCCGVMAMDFALEFARFADLVLGAAVPFAPVPVPSGTAAILRVLATGLVATVVLTYALHAFRTPHSSGQQSRVFLAAGSAAGASLTGSQESYGGGRPRRGRVHHGQFRGQTSVEPHLFALLSTVFLWSGAFAACWAIGLHSPILMSIAGACWGAGYACRNVASGSRSALTCITTYAIMTALPCAANAFGLLMLNEVERERFFVFAAPEHLYLATQLALASAVLPIAGFVLVSKGTGTIDSSMPLPRVGWSMSDGQLLFGCGSVGVLALLIHHFDPVRFPNSLQSLLGMLPTMAVFVLARAAAANRVRGAFALAVGIAVAASLRAFLFDYLRSPIAYPYFALAVGLWFGSGRLATVFRLSMLPIYLAAAVYVANYGILGATRENAPYGLARIGFIANYKEMLNERGEAVKQTFASRVSNFNQLSQVGRIAEQDGYYNGGTLTYLTFAFIPRLLWPEKPRIERGSWFAVRIGYGRATQDGWFNNTINMTQAGELYLNFGWIGVVVGLLLYGGLLAMLWTTAGIHNSQNALGGAWGYYLIFVTLGQFGDLTIVVTLFAMYTLFVFATAIHHLMAGDSLRRMRSR